MTTRTRPRHRFKSGALYSLMLLSTPGPRRHPRERDTRPGWVSDQLRADAQAKRERRAERNRRLAS